MKRTFTMYPSSYVKASSTMRTVDGGEISYTRYYGYTGFQKLNIPDNRYVLEVKYFHQYAEGVTGANHSRTIYTTPEGFKTKTEAREFMKLIKLKPYSKKGRPTPYGNIGAESLAVDIVPAGNIKDGYTPYFQIDAVYLFD